MYADSGKSSSILSERYLRKTSTSCTPSRQYVIERESKAKVKAQRKVTHTSTKKKYVLILHSIQFVGWFKKFYTSVHGHGRLVQSDTNLASQGSSIQPCCNYHMKTIRSHISATVYSQVQKNELWRRGENKNGQASKRQQRG